MVRTPCCEKMGLKKGSWTREEDQILISHIQRYGHGIWRALPKQAGLLRCGKSCRLRWINYLSPDIKRGKFSKEEEEIILKLHGILGNRWATIATRLPGRTDNEIKNFWHTHLKKRLERSKVINTYSNPLQEAQTASSARTLISVPRVAVEASGASSSRNPPIVGLGFYGVASSDILGQIIGNSSHSRQIDKELEFRSNVYMNSHHKGMKM